ncbi:acyl carrier protein [bacterium]|nr:acyl carrier protein [bacterium]
MSGDDEGVMAGADPEITVVLDRLRDAFRRAFFDDTLEIRLSDTAADIDGWDSLSHVRLLLTIERHFAIRLDPEETVRLDNVGALARLVVHKLDAASQGDDDDGR